MSTELKPYPKYRDSGIPWLGKVPEHWAVIPNRAVFQEIKDQDHPDDEMLSVTITRGVIRQQAMLARSGKKDSSNQDRSKYKLVCPGDIAYNKMRAWQGAFGRSSYRGIISPAYIVVRLRSKENSSLYFHNLLRTPLFAKEAERYSYGIVSDMWSLRSEDFKRIYVPLPPPSEQAAIARYLAHATAKIDAAIAAQKRVIALLEEEKRAIIQRAVTKGLDPDAKMKDSGVPWIGEIPEGWEVRRLKSLIKRIDQGISPQASNRLASAHTWGVLKAGCVNYGFFRETEHKQLDKSFPIEDSIVVHKGDVLISRACGSVNLVGSVGRVNELHYNLILSDKTFRPLFLPGVNTEFMVHALNSHYYRQQVSDSISGAEGLANNLPLSSLRSFQIVVPPTIDCNKIARFLDCETRNIARKITSIGTDISLLREYRTRLVADLVTGKLDVRAAAEGLPEIDEVPAAVAAGDEELESEEDEDDAEA